VKRLLRGVQAFADAVRIEDAPPPAATAPVEEGPSHVRLIAREVYTTQRAHLVPWAALLVMATAAGAVQHGHAPAFEVILAVPGLAVLGYVATRTILTDRAVDAGDLEEGQRTGRRVRRITARARQSSICGALAGGWLTGAAATDPATWPGRVVWVVGTLVWALAADRMVWQPLRQAEAARPAQSWTTPATTVEQPDTATATVDGLEPHQPLADPPADPSPASPAPARPVGHAAAPAGELAVPLPATSAMAVAQPAASAVAAVAPRRRPTCSRTATPRRPVPGPTTRSSRR
jgi:hypothetical protein